jgi:hypothetical protein
MARTTGMILAIGAITFTNQHILHDDPVDLRIPIATGFTALAFAGLEKVWSDGAMALASLGLVTVLLTRINGKPAPLETLAEWSGYTVKKSLKKNG